jgi:DNA recombination protein RmuC
MSAEALIALAVAAATGVAIGWLVASSRSAAAKAVAESAVTELRGQLARSQAEVTEARAGLRQAELAQAAATARANEYQTRLEEERKLLDEAKSKLSDAFAAIASKALDQNNAGFLALATERLGTVRTEAERDLEARKQAIEVLVKPLGDSLATMAAQIQALETARGEAYGTLTEQLRSLATTENQLRSETASLVTALRAPKLRGNWGEVQLKRVVELAGMVNHCDFFEQETVNTEDGMLRPDLRVQLPGGRNIIIDSKVPLDAYLRALEAKTEDERIRELRNHAAQVRARMNDLSSKRYWQHLQPAPEFVVLFLPAESFYDAALQYDPALIEESVTQQVIIATATTLIALLKSVSYGWKQQQVEENARQISREGQQVYERIGNVAGYLRALRAALERAVLEFNNTIGSFEGRLMVSARKLKELGASTETELPDIARIESSPREISVTNTDPAARKD